MAQKCDIDKIINSLRELQDQLSGIPPSNKEATVNNNEQPGKKKEEKRQSLGVWVKGIFKKNGKVKKGASNHASDSGGSQGGSRRNKSEDLEDADLVIRKLQSDIFQMINAFKNLTEFQTNMRNRLEHDIHKKKLGAILKKTESIRSRSHDLKEIRRKVFTLKCQIPSLLHKQSSRGISIKDSQTAEENDEIQETGNDIYLPGLHVSEDFKNSSAFEEVVEKFQGLDFHKQLCLLSFAVFPENKEVERTMLMYWWIGEGFIKYDGSEKLVTIILDEFSTNGLLEPVEDERKLKPSSYRMEPHVHSAVICLAKTVGLFRVYNEKGKLIMKKSLRDKVCLVKGSSLLQEAKASKMDPKTLQTIFNSSERYPDFTFKWFRSMKSLRVLYLGRWERTAKRHIEVESTEFLKYVETLKNLRLASFQGISRIEKLENSICALPELVILDLKACYNLELLPDDIGLFEKLIYLDVSECYMLDHMPKGIAKLSKLQVLKGFVISESDNEKDCAVKHLLNLRKLSITVNKFTFTVENLMESLAGLKKLESLKIAWGFQFHKDGDTGKVDPKEGTKHDEVEATESKSDKVVEGDEKTSPPQASKDTIHNKTGGEGDGDKGKADPKEGTKHDEVKATESKSDKVVEGDEKTSPPQASKDTIHNKTGGEGDGDKGKADPKEGTKHDEVKATESKSDKVVEGDEKTSPPQAYKDTIHNKTGGEGDGDKGKADPKEGTKHDEVKATESKSDKVVERDEKTSPPQAYKDTIHNKTGGEGDGDKGKADPKEGTKHDEVEAEISKSDNGVEGVKKPNPSPDDHKENSKVQEKGDGNKGNDDLDEGKKKNEVKAESSKPDKVIEGDGKRNPPQESKDTNQSKADDHREISKVQEKREGVNNGDDLKKLDGGEAKTQKSHKTNKFGKTDDLKNDNAMAKEIHKIASPSRSIKAKLLKALEKWGRGRQENQEIDTSKLPSSLKKLELESFPKTDPPSWLNPKDLNNLTKLSIKGGKLSRIRLSDELPTKEDEWPVKILRLKYLHEFKAEWKDLQALFPDMTLLEKYKCPNISFCPTDGNGVWRKPDKSPNM